MTARWKLGWYCKTWRPFHTTSPFQIYNWQQTLHKSLRNFITCSTPCKLPNESGILIRPPDQKSLHSMRRRKHTAHDADDFASLPPHKKVKKSSHRVGIKADRKRKQSEIQVNICIKIVTQSSSQLYYVCLTIIYSSAQSSLFSKKSHLVCMSHNAVFYVLPNYAVNDHVFMWQSW